eukprot:1555820-Amphidinium_carterae.3
MFLREPNIGEAIVFHPQLGLAAKRGAGIAISGHDLPSLGKFSVMRLRGLGFEERLPCEVALEQNSPPYNMGTLMAVLLL